MNLEYLTGPETIPITKSAGRVAYCTLIAKHDSPPFTLSRFDGYALGEPKNGKRDVFKITHDMPITAGDGTTYYLSRGEAIPIMTGAPVPNGTHQVIPSEMCRRKNRFLFIDQYPGKGRMILERGANFSKGQILLKRREVINPVHVAFMALDGRETIDVFSLPSVFVVSFGDELTSVREVSLKAGKIRNSHPSLIQALLSPYGIIKQQTHVADDIKIMKATLEKFLASDQVIGITTGGMGQGIKDLTPKTLEEIGAAPLFRGVNAFPIGTFSCYQCKNKLIFSLPGGIVGVLLLTRLFIYPFVRKAQGWLPPSSIGPFYQAKLEDGSKSSLKKLRKRVRFIKARVWDDKGIKKVKPLSSKSSLTEMNAFILKGFRNLIKGNHEPGWVPVFILWNESDD